MQKLTLFITAVCVLLTSSCRQHNRLLFGVETFQNIVTKTLREFQPFHHALPSLPSLPSLPVPQWGLHVLSFED